MASSALLAARAGDLAQATPYPSSLAAGGFFAYNTGAVNYTIVARLAVGATNNGAQRWSVFWGGEQLANDGAHRSSAAEVTDSPSASDFMLNNAGSGYSVQASGAGVWQNAGTWIKVVWAATTTTVYTSPDGVTYTQRYQWTRNPSNGGNDTWISVQASSGNPVSTFLMDNISVSTP